MIVHSPPSYPPGVTVVGVGKASAPPDIARTSVGVEVRAASAEQATSDATARMNAVVQAIKTAGVPDKDLRTHNLSISFEQEPVAPTPLPVVQAKPASPQAGTRAAPAPTPEPAPRGFFRVSNMVEVTVRDLNAVGRILKAATDAGANSAWGITFELEDDTALTTAARSQAVNRAKLAAQELADLTGVTLGKVLSIEENPDSGGYNGGGGGMMAYRAAANDSALPIERGEITQSYTIQITYATKN
jgi:uncharacterized protein YggE